VTDSQIDTIAKIAEKISAEDNRRTRQVGAISALLKRRQQVLVSMCELADLESSDVTTEKVIAELKTFNQMLIDYSALGHLEIYERIVDGRERRGNIKQVADRVYPIISESTRRIIDFNDKYEGSDDAESLQGLYSDLSEIGEVMVERIEYEDMLLREISDQIEISA